LTRNSTKLLDQYGLRKKNHCIHENESSNFNATNVALKFVAHCQALGLEFFGCERMLIFIFTWDLV
jgi:hypothetical protein